ncbi:MAG: AAA family ATPase [Myxococcales bacterium]|nr:AAA family ATPase [Myxococcales bacterium]
MRPEGIDVLILTALREELDELLAETQSLDGPWSTHKDATGVLPTVHSAILRGPHGGLAIAAARATKMGPVGTATVAERLVPVLKPQCIAMCGVCAGRPGDTELGDVIIADRVFLHDEGKRKANAFEGDLSVSEIDDRWLEIAQDISGPGDRFECYTGHDVSTARWWILEKLYRGDPVVGAHAVSRVADLRKRIVEGLEADGLVELQGLQCILTQKGRAQTERYLALSESVVRHPFHVHVGPMGSGNYVAADDSTWASLSGRGMRKVIGVEMEAAAIGRVAHIHRLKFLVVKGVMDHADSKKDDRFKRFAAKASAQVLLHTLATLVQPREDNTEAKTSSPHDSRGIPRLLRPRASPSFKNREGIRKALRNALSADDPISIVLVGPPGYGKTDLVSKVVDEVEGADGRQCRFIYYDCYEGVRLRDIFVEAGRMVGRAEEFERMYSSLNQEERILFFYRELSAGENLWVLLDNFERMLGADDEIQDSDLRLFVQAGLGSRHRVCLLLVTRRTPKTPPRARVRHLALSDGLPLDLAVDFLVEAGRDCGMSLDRQLLSLFVERYSSAPKALESLIGYLQQMHHVVSLGDLLSRGGAFERFKSYDFQQGLLAVIVEQISSERPTMRRALRALAAFEVSATQETLSLAFPEVAWDEALARLCSIRLCTRRGEAFAVHPLVREAVVSTSSLDESRGVHIRAADYFREASQPLDIWSAPDDVRPRLDEFYHRASAGQYDEACRILDAISHDFLGRWGWYDEIARLRQSIEEKIEDRSLRLLNMARLAVAESRLGERVSALGRAERAVAEAESPRIVQVLEQCLNNLGIVYYHAKMHERAIAAYSRALDLAREVRTDRLVRVRLVNIAEAHLELANVAQAEMCASEAMLIDVGDRTARYNGWCRHALGRCSLLRGNLEDARVHFGASLESARAYNERRRMAMALLRLSLSSALAGEYDAALQVCEEGLAVAIEIGASNVLSECRCMAGFLAHMRGDLESAAMHYRAGIALRGEGDEVMYAMCIFLGILFIERGDSAESLLWLRKGVEGAKVLEGRSLGAFAPRLRHALAMLSLGDSEGGQRYRSMVSEATPKGIILQARMELGLLERAIPKGEMVSEALSLVGGRLA